MEPISELELVTDKKFKKGDFVLTENGESAMLIIDDMLGKSNDGIQCFDGTYQCAWLDNNQDLRIACFWEDDLIMLR